MTIEQRAEDLVGACRPYRRPSGPDWCFEHGAAAGHDGTCEKWHRAVETLTEIAHDALDGLASHINSHSTGRMRAGVCRAIHEYAEERYGTSRSTLHS